MKAEVYNVYIALSSERTELQPHITRTENFVKFGHVVFQIYKLTDRQTDRQTVIAILRAHPGRSKHGILKATQGH